MLHHELALALSRSIADRQGECRALTLLSADRRRQGNVPAAMEIVRTAVDACAARTDLLARALLRVEHGRVLALGDDPAARSVIESGLALSEQMHDPVGIASAHDALADLAERRGDLRLALEEAEHAIHALDSLRASIAATDQLARFTGVQQVAYDRAIALHLKRYAIDPAARDDLRALELVAATRARTLAERLNAPDMRAVASREDTSWTRYTETRRSAAHLTNLYFAALEKGEQTAIEKAEIASRTERSQLERLERELFPAPRNGPSTKTVLADLQASLDDEAMVLVYWLSADAGRLWSVTNARITSAELPASEEIETLARRFYANARDAARTSRDDAVTRDALSQLLLQPIPELERFAELYISADGVLDYVPFAALSLPGDGAGLVLDRHRTASLPALVRPPAAPTAAAILPHAVVFADPVYGAGDERLPPGLTESDPLGEEPVARLRSVLTALPRLLRSRAEADAVVQSLGAGQAETFLDFNATRERLLGLDQSDANLLLIAAHTLVRSDSNAGSGIVLSLFDATGRPQSGFVSYYDLLQLRRSPALVVLDGCETGLGVNIRGEGPVGIARAFMYAGASQVVSTLWPAGDRSSAGLMRAFYHGLLAEGRSPADALQQAQLGLRDATQRSRRPSVWAGYTVAYRWPLRDGKASVLAAATIAARDGT
jgi:CHAT domain-containing protein